MRRDLSVALNPSCGVTHQFCFQCKTPPKTFIVLFMRPSSFVGRVSDCFAAKQWLWLRFYFVCLSFHCFQDQWLEVIAIDYLKRYELLYRFLKLRPNMSLCCSPKLVLVTDSLSEVPISRDLFDFEVKRHKLFSSHLAILISGFLKLYCHINDF